MKKQVINFFIQGGLYPLTAAVKFSPEPLFLVSRLSFILRYTVNNTY